MAIAVNLMSFHQMVTIRDSSGYGAKLTNIYSKTFVVETVDSSCQLLGVCPFFFYTKQMVKKTVFVVKTMENKPPMTGKSGNIPPLKTEKHVFFFTGTVVMW